MLPGQTTNAPLDTTTVVVTPENVSFDFRLAGPFHRIIAFFIDMVIMGGVLMLSLTLLGMLLGLGGIGLGLVLAFVLWWGYSSLLETWNNGQTLGKMSVGLRVVSETGLAINGQQAILRTILRSADLAPPFFPGLIAMLCNRRFQRLGDLAAGTVVIIDSRRKAPPTPTLDEDLAEIYELIPLRYQPTPDLVDALTAYVGRRNELSRSRQQELAENLAIHFIRTWGLPDHTDPDFLLCGMYEKAVGNTTPKPKRRTVKASSSGNRDKARVLQDRALKDRSAQGNSVTTLAARKRAGGAESGRRSP